MDGNDVVDTFNRGENVVFMVDDTEVSLAKEDVLTEATQKPGFAAQIDGDVTVVLDCNLTEELITEGYQREMISKLQNMRKDADFEVSDRITVTYECKDKLAEAIEAGRDFIMTSVLATSMERVAAPEGVEAKEWDLNGKKITIAIQKV